MWYLAAVALNTHMIQSSDDDELRSPADLVLNAAGERLRQAVAASGAGTWEMKLPTQEVTACLRFRELFGLSAYEDLSLDKCVACIHEDDVLRVNRTVWAALQGENGGRYIDEYRLKNARGLPVWVEARGQLRLDKHGEPLLLHGTVVDISERKQAESLVLQKADFERQLIGIVSHDLRNPLGVIALGCSVLLRGEEDLSGRQTKLLVRMQNSAERAVRMIRDLLDFTQARLTGSIHIARRDADLREVTKTVLDEVQATYPSREVKFFSRGDCHGQWDPDRISQVVQNLLANAFKYSPHRSAITIKIDSDDANVCLSVHNYGPEIPPDRIEGIFRPFERATKDIDASARSIGLGLYIVDQIVRAHDGSVTVHSTAAAGTTFTIRMPHRETGRDSDTDNPEALEFARKSS